MKNTTKAKSLITIFGYLLAVILFLYFCYLTSATLKEIILYESEIAKLGFMEKSTYLLSNISTLALSAITALATKIYAIVVPDKMKNERQKAVEKQDDKQPANNDDHSQQSVAVQVPNLYNENETLIVKDGKVVDKKKIANKLKKAYDEKQKSVKTTEKATPKKVKTMTLQEAADKLGVSKDRVYRYCKSSGICDSHKNESPIRITGDEFKLVKAHFTTK